MSLCYVTKSVTASALSILFHGVISLSDVMSCDRVLMKISQRSFLAMSRQESFHCGESLVTAMAHSVLCTVLLK